VEGAHGVWWRARRGFPTGDPNAGAEGFPTGDPNAGVEGSSSDDGSMSSFFEGDSETGDVSFAGDGIAD
jgi:hypothetical protein